MLSGNGDLDPKRIGEVSVDSEKQGFGGLWFGETTLRDASVLTTIAACATKKIQLGTSIVNVFTRSPGQLALMAATINELSGGRFTLGLGVSTSAIIQNWHGIHFDRSFQRLTETVKMLRLYFEGERFSLQGKFSSPTNARLRISSPPKIALAALNDKMIRKAAALGDRIILNLYPPDRVNHAVAIIDEARLKAGLKERPNLSVMLYAYVLDDEKAGLDAAKDLISFYASAPAYSKLFSSLGFDSEARAMMEAWKTRDRETVKKNVTRAMVDRLTVLGTIRDLRERVRVYHENGVDDVFIAPTPFGDYKANLNEILHNYFVEG